MDNKDFNTSGNSENFNKPSFNNPENFGFYNTKKLPNASGILVLGIVSCVAWLCYGIPGIVCAVISLVLSRKANELYVLNPAQYSQSSYSQVRAGRTCATIGLIIGTLSFLGYAILIIIGIMADAEYSRG